MPRPHRPARRLWAVQGLLAVAVQNVRPGAHLLDDRPQLLEILRVAQGLLMQGRPQRGLFCGLPCFRRLAMSVHGGYTDGDVPRPSAVLGVGRTNRRRIGESHLCT